ncbi:small-conductance mechanosensitive channel [Mycobacteroides abscessus subsp. abscessus]|nr:small-conductance mechanosensitive channel [Mycobacteroides abscessus subsp. abscessus]
MRRPDGTVSATPAGGLEYQTTIPLHSPADDGDTKKLFLQWVWYASRRAGLHLDEAEDDFATTERLAEAVADVVAPTLRLSADQQRELLGAANLERYGIGELVQRVGEVPERMTFILSGRVQLTASSDDGAETLIGILENGSYLGQSTLTRQPVIGNAHALDEVTVVHVERDHIETVVQRNPVLLQEFGRIIEDRRAHARRLLSAD